MLPDQTPSQGTVVQFPEPVPTLKNLPRQPIRLTAKEEVYSESIRVEEEKNPVASTKYANSDNPNSIFKEVHVDFEVDMQGGNLHVPTREVKKKEAKVEAAKICSHGRWIF